MSVRVHLSVSIDGYAAGLNQDLENPLGIGGMAIMDWFFHTRTWRSMHGQHGGEQGIDDQMAAKAMTGVGAWILGRNMFGPIRGPWPDDSWKGWWGDEPPYHVPVYVLTHYARPTVKMAGGTDFHFVTDGIHAALNRARESAGGRDVRIGGGVATVRQYLQARLIDELHFGMPTVLLGNGESLLSGLDLPALGYQAVQQVAGERAAHVLIRKQ